MDGDQIATPEREALEPADRSLIEDLRLLAADARTVAEAELAYQKSRARLFGGGIGQIVGLGAVALLLLSLAMIALVVGLVLALTPLLTAGGATGLVTGGLIVAAACAALWARSRWRMLLAQIAGDEITP